MDTYVDGHFLLLWIMLLWIFCVCIYSGLCFQIFGVYRSQVAGLYDNSVFTFRNPKLLQSGHSILHFHQQSTARIPIAPHPHHLFLSLIATLMGIKCYLIVVLICLSLLAFDAKHLFMCLLAICISSMEQYLSKSFAHF